MFLIGPPFVPLSALYGNQLPFLEKFLGCSRCVLSGPSVLITLEPNIRPTAMAQEPLEVILMPPRSHKKSPRTYFEYLTVDSKGDGGYTTIHLSPHPTWHQRAQKGTKRKSGGEKRKLNMEKRQRRKDLFSVYQEHSRSRLEGLQSPTVTIARDSAHLELDPQHRVSEPSRNAAHSSAPLHKSAHIFCEICVE